MRGVAIWKVKFGKCVTGVSRRDTVRREADGDAIAWQCCVGAAAGKTAEARHAAGFVPVRTRGEHGRAGLTFGTGRGREGFISRGKID